VDSKDPGSAAPSGPADRRTHPDRVTRLHGTGRRTLLTGWFSFFDGETTAGDAMALDHVRARLERAGVAYDVAWSKGMRPEAMSLEEAVPAHYTHLVFVCGPVHGDRVAALHERFAHCVRVAVGTSTVDASDPAVGGFHRVLARDGAGTRLERLDLAAAAPVQPPVPVVGVILTHGQREYGDRRAHDAVAGTLTGWLAGKDCARVELDTRLDARDWRHARTAGQFLSAVARMDVVVTDRLHGLVLALRAGVPAVAVDPVRGGAKLSAQARVCRWPALVPAERACPDELEQWWSWCLGPGRAWAERRARQFDRLRPDG
jgi:hypothetical protein